MVVTISHNGYIKRTAASTYRAQHRGGKGLTGAKTEDEDPIAHLFAASTHDYLLFFTNRGKVYWQKVYDLPQLSRESRGRAVVNLLNFAPNERVADCRPVRDFLPGSFLMMATRKGLVKKTPLEAYGRPLKGGMIAIKLKEDDELIDVVVTPPGDEVVLATAHGMAIRFNQADARPMGRNTSGVKGISISGDDRLVGMVVADPNTTLLTACAGLRQAHAYSERTASDGSGASRFGSGSHPGSRIGRIAGKRASPRSRRRRKKTNRRMMCRTMLRRNSATAPSPAAARACATSRPPSATAK